jgi:hypothetical protein
VTVKRIASILMLLIFSFNLIGYRFLFDFLQQRNDDNLQAALDQDKYNESDLISIRIPLSMPYQPENTEFERVNGEVTVDGIIYKYVKRKIDHGDLVLLCLLDHKKMKLQSGKEQFFRLANEFQQTSPMKHSGQGKTTTTFKLSIFDLPACALLLPACLPLQPIRILDASTIQSAPFIGSVERPPGGTAII